MRKYLAVALIAGFIGFVLGNAFWYLASPLWIDNVVDEQIAAELTQTQLVSGEFRDADSSHKGSGTASIFKSAGGTHTLAFENFEVTNGPDLEVWLVKEANPENSQSVKDSQWVSLGLLKGNIGNQNYTIPPSIDPSEFGSAVIWCEQFGVLFAVASLK